MHCIQMVYEKGGSKTILAETPEACIEACKRMQGSFAAATVPFEVFMGAGGMYDVSIPPDMRADLGEQLVKMYMRID